MTSRILHAHPDPAPDDVVRAAQARLLARLGGPADAPADADRYEFGAPLAAGGLGLVRRAYDRHLARTVAVKQLHRCDPASERRFLFEAEVTARLQHPGIVPVHDIGRFASGEPYYCMKLVDGPALAEVVRDVPAARRLTLLPHVLAAADAVAHAHAHAVVHRDLKPANILVGAHGETVVIDWGLARDLDDPPLEPPGTVVGTPNYMPPEQARGALVDARSDVFALGATLFHVLAGRPPHADLARLRRDDVEDPAAIAAPDELLAVIRRAMAPRPADRYPDAAALAADLRRFLAGRLVAAHTYGPAALLRLWIRRHRAVVALAGLSALLLATATLVFLVRLRAERDAADVARRHAVAAELEAVRRADAAVLAEARGLVAEDAAAALATLARLDLRDDAARRHARLTELAAHARGAPDRLLRGHTRPIESLAALSDGGLVSIDAAGEVWRWDAAGRGEQLLDLASPRGLVIAAADAPVWAALAADRGYVVRGDEPPEPIALAPFDLREFQTHRWQLSRHGEVLAALGTANHLVGRSFAAAYTWDLQARPAFARALPLPHVGAAALAPDGATVAVRGRDLALAVTGDVTRALGPFAPHLYTVDGQTLIGATLTSPREDVAWTAGRTRPLGGRAIAVTPDDHVLVLDRSDPLRRTRLALRSLDRVDRWTIDVDDTHELRAAVALDDGSLAVDPRGAWLAMHLDDRWQLRSLVDGRLVRSLDTGRHRRGVFLADGRLAAAHHHDLWLWDPPPRADEIPYLAAISPDGRRAIAGAVEARRIDLPDRRDVAVPCLRDVPLGEALFTAPRRATFTRRLALDDAGRILYLDGATACLQDPDGAATTVAVRPDATVVALGAAPILGHADGLVEAAPDRWQLGAAVTRLWSGAPILAHTAAGELWALRPDSQLRLGASRVVDVARSPRATAVLLPDEDAVVFLDPAGVTRRPCALAEVPAAAYSPSGARFVVAVGGPALLVLGAPEDPGREIPVPDDVRGLAFLDEDQLVVVGPGRALARVDLVIGDAVRLRGPADRIRSTAPARVWVRADGGLTIADEHTLRLEPAD